MFITNFVLSFCATAIIFLNSADALQLDVAGIVKVGIGEEKKTHPLTKATCAGTYGSGAYRCAHQVNKNAFFLDKNYYSSGEEFCSQLIVCNTNGKLTRLGSSQYPPNGTPCGNEDNPSKVCYQRECRAAADPKNFKSCNDDFLTSQQNVRSDPKLG